MSDSVKRIMDRLFAGDGADESIRALREEIENNCEEHYDDLIRQGYGEEEAAAEISRSLQGMEDVIAGMRKEAGTAEKETEPAAEPAAAAEGPEIPVNPGNAEKETERETEKETKKEADNPEPVSVDGHLILSADGVETLKVNATSESLAFLPSDDGRIHVIWDTESGRRVTAERTGSTLRVTASMDVGADGARKADSDGRPFRDANGNFSLNLDDLLNFVRKAVTNGMMKVIPAQIRIRMPEALLPGLDASSRSGDIEVAGLSLREGTLRSGSGDVEVREGAVRESLNCASTSGDITVSVPAEKTVLSSISGDLSYTGDTRELRLQSTSGDIEMDTRCETGEASSVSGSIDAEVRGARSLTLRSTSGDVDLDWENNAPTQFETHSVSGDVTNHVGNQPGAAVTVRIRTISGDITIR